MPAIGNALQLSFSDVIEREAGTRDEIFDCMGDEDFGWPGACHHASADRNSDPRALAVDDLAFAGVHPGTNLDP